MVQIYNKAKFTIELIDCNNQLNLFYGETLINIV